jgi:integrase
MEIERIRLGPGVSLYRERVSWLLDLTLEGGGRLRKSMGKNRWKAIEETARAAGEGNLPKPPAERFQPAQQGTETSVTFTGPAVYLPKPPPGVTPLAPRPQVVARPAETPQVRRGISIEEAVSKYTTYLLKTKGDDPDHVDNVGGQIRMLQDHFKLDRVEQIEPHHIVEYLNSFADGPPSTRRQKLWTIRTWLRWCRAMRWISSDATEGISPPRVKRKKVRYLTFEEVERLLKASKGTPIKDHIKVALYTGLRAKELRSLDPADVDLKGRWLNLENTKTGRPRDIPIFDQCYPAFRRFMKERTFGITKSGYWERQFKEVFEKANLPQPGFRILRRTFATHLLLEGIEQYIVAKWDGHDLRTQERHYAGYRRSDRPMKFTWFGKIVPKDGVLEIPKPKKGDRGKR